VIGVDGDGWDGGWMLMNGFRLEPRCSEIGAVHFNSTYGGRSRYLDYLILLDVEWGEGGGVLSSYIDLPLAK
jgi:hypothetical protein